MDHHYLSCHKSWFYSSNLIAGVPTITLSPRNSRKGAGYISSKMSAVNNNNNLIAYTSNFPSSAIFTRTLTKKVPTTKLPMPHSMSLISLNIQTIFSWLSCHLVYLFLRWSLLLIGWHAYPPKKTTLCGSQISNALQWIARTSVFAVNRYSCACATLAEVCEPFKPLTKQNSKLLQRAAKLEHTTSRLSDEINNHDLVSNDVGVVLKKSRKSQKI